MESFGELRGLLAGECGSAPGREWYLCWSSVNGLRTHEVNKTCVFPQAGHHLQKEKSSAHVADKIPGRAMIMHIPRRKHRHGADLGVEWCSGLVAPAKQVHLNVIPA